jgi:hypothetical protein
MPESAFHAIVAPETLGHVIASVGILVHATWPDVEADPACRMIAATASELYAALVGGNPQRAAELFDRLEHLRATL